MDKFFKVDDMGTYRRQSDGRTYEVCPRCGEEPEVVELHQWHDAVEIGRDKNNRPIYESVTRTALEQRCPKCGYIWTN